MGRTWCFKFFLGLFIFLQGHNVLAEGFPTCPDLQLTPGSLCSEKKVKRYPEGVYYCSRDVDRSTKQSVIENYDRVLGFDVGTMDRGEFKIDHFIPLCAGGSNATSNLWPQHRSIYELTDPLEGEVCTHMQLGLLKQTEVIDIIRKAKAFPESAPEVFLHLKNHRLRINNNRILN
jgi:hypothetical protein